jgi:hypothetical protein
VSSFSIPTPISQACGRRVLIYARTRSRRQGSADTGSTAISRSRTNASDAHVAEFGSEGSRAPAPAAGLSGYAAGLSGYIDSKSEDAGHSTRLAKRLRELLPPGRVFSNKVAERVREPNHDVPDVPGEAVDTVARQVHDLAADAIALRCREYPLALPGRMEVRGEHVSTLRPAGGRAEEVIEESRVDQEGLDHRVRQRTAETRRPQELVRGGAQHFHLIADVFGYLGLVLLGGHDTLCAHAQSEGCDDRSNNRDVIMVVLCSGGRGSVTTKRLLVQE